MFIDASITHHVMIRVGRFKLYHTMARHCCTATQAAQRGDDMTVSNLAREMDKTFHEYQSCLSNVERKRRVDLTCRGSRSRAQARSGKGAINASPTDDRKSCSSGGESSERLAFQLTPQRSDCTDEQVAATASAASMSKHASYDTDGFFLVSVNGRSIADLQRLIQRAASIGNEVLQQKLNEMRRTVAKFHDHLLLEEQKLTRIEDYVAGKQRLPSDRNGRPGQNQAASPATKPTNSPKSAGDTSQRVKYRKDNAVERAKKPQE